MIEPATLSFSADGTPFSPTYDDVYHASAGGLEQARHVFLQGNGLPERWQGRDCFVILETGFGLGLNLLATWQRWREDPRRCRRLHFVSVESHPFSVADLKSLHARWPELAAPARALRGQWPPAVAGFHRLHFEQDALTLTLLLGEAGEWLPRLEAGVDAFYFDGFAPAKNPELWSPELLRTATRLARPGATLATWSVAAPVREALAAAGWRLQKREGYAHKRDMLAGRLPGEEREAARERSALVVGAGIAGSTLAERLARRGWAVTVLERQLGPAMEGSGNPAGIVLPLPAKDDNIVARISRACFLHAMRRLRALSAPDLRWDASGVVQLGRDEQHLELQRETVRRHGLPAEYIRFLDSAEMAQLLGRRVALGGWLFPGGGWLSPAGLCRGLLDDAAIDTRYAAAVQRIERGDGGWRAVDASGRVLGEAAHLVLANAQEALRFWPDLPLQRVRGQTTCLPMQHFSGLRHAVCRKSYLVPAGGDRPDGIAYLGASFDPDDSDTALRAGSHAENLAGLEAMLPGTLGPLDCINPATLPGRVGFRSMSPDRLPLAGRLPVPVDAIPSNLALADMERQPGLHCLLGYGARGLVWSALMAELLASQLEAEPLPLEKELVAALDPARFLLRRLRRG